MGEISREVLPNGLVVTVRDDVIPLHPDLAVYQARKHLAKRVEVRRPKTIDERRANRLAARIAAGEVIDLDDDRVWNFAP